MSPHPPAETIEAHGCSIVLRRVEGPEARELFLHARPPAGAADAGAQSEAIYRAIVDALAAEGGRFASVVGETLFLRSLPADLAAVRAARARVLRAGEGTLAASEAPTHRPATSEIEQPPLDARARLEVALQAVLPLRPSGPPLPTECFATRPACGCAECARAHGLRVVVGPEARLHASGLYGLGADVYEQTHAMFRVAEDLLAQAGMDFRDVVRTCIHLREMDRDYADLNRARREFFAARGIDPAPASTGIGGGPASAGHDVCLGVQALRSLGTGGAGHVGSGSPARTAMSAPTLNEAPTYGSDFSRGMRVEEANKLALHVSGTASIDEAGRTAHPGDFDAQADRMLVNVAGLLEAQGAGFADVVSAVTYLKRPEDAARLRAKLREAGYEGFPNVLVLAPICRPDLLCETEALAALGIRSR